KLNRLEAVNIIVIYFNLNSKAPITLLELGLYTRSRKIIMYCSKGYWQRGNI
ncbi:hypothetical protein K432DRAFT_315850, partial [Lepidopterella palustris CBS 459.81]